MNTHNQNDFRFRPRRPAGDDQAHYAPLRIPSRTVTSEALFNGLYEIGINHGGALYRLKITRQGKLILNK
ncbi:MAG: hemin uptake protein HemP [Pseudomonadota bacterium]|nr:hemin uptake protein HemP [Pseudomonadota bacterium]MDQ2703890.1 hemin uptake protein HemP [Pseudomonadota bacterium]